ncbi:MAG TPA: tryptophan 7-halogenase [Tepidisphaeraceae bacterium]|jgi:tryptophan halogenase
MVTSVLVLGGGSAGFLAAITLKIRLPALQVTVLRSPDVGIIGVGEGTTVGVTSHLHGYLGIDPGVFQREAAPIWKLGIRFLWGERPEFYYAFSRHMDARHADLPKPVGFYACEDMVDYGVHAALMARNHAFARDANGFPVVDGTYGYHLENQTFVGWLEKAAGQLGIAITDGTVAHVNRGKQGIAGLALADGRTMTADLHIDASGFRSLLMRQTLGEPFADYAPSLWCDSAVVGGWDRGADEPIQPYTVAETMDAGWCWRIDHEHRINRGYVYCSSFISDDQAEAEFRRKNANVGATRVVRFVSGRVERAWVGNVVAIGNAFGFVEPLEATSLSMICQWARNVAEILHDGDRVVRPSQVSLYNAVHSRTFDAVRWFLSIHYKFNGRLQTPFWRECREKVDYSGAAAVVEFFRENGPSGFSRALLDPTDPFGIEGYLVLLVGQQVPVQSRYVPADSERQIWAGHRAVIRRTADAGVPVAEALPILRSPQWRWDRRRFTN